MAVFETEALILRSYNLAEADKIIVCLSRSSGLIRGVAKGCRKLKNRFGAALEPFTLINLTYYEKENQELVSFRQVEILKSHFNLASNASIDAKSSPTAPSVRDRTRSIDPDADQPAAACELRAARKSAVTRSANDSGPA